MKVQENEHEKGLNANQIKLIAIGAMTLDHLTWTLFPGYNTEWYVILFHIIGRLTAPIMWFFIAEGYHYTHDVKKYAGRLFLLAFMSHFAYNFCFGIPFIPLQTTVFNQTGVVWSLAWGLVLLYIYDKTSLKSWQKSFITIAVCLITFPSDWSCIATMAILAIGTNRGNFKKQMIHMMLWTGIYALVYFLFIDKVYAVIQLFTCLTIPLLRPARNCEADSCEHRLFLKLFYNGKRGSMKGIGKLFYIYYPLHLFVCGIIRVLLWGAGFSTGTANL